MTTASDTALLVRDTAGLHVEVNYLPIIGMLALNVRHGDACAAVTIAPDRALDAFDHPTVYLNDAQVAQLFPKVTSA